MKTKTSEQPDAKIPKGHASSWMALAIQLGVSGPTMTKYRKMPDAPINRDMAAWAAWVRIYAGKKREESITPKSRAILRKLEAEAEKIEIANAKEKMLWWRASEVKEQILGCVAEIESEVQALENDLPGMLVGLTVPEMVIVMRRAWQGVRQRIYGGRLKPVIGEI